MPGINSQIGIGRVRQGTQVNQNANVLGFLPTATAAENVASWNSLKSGIVNIDIAGVYDIDGSLLLNSNTTYNFAEGCTIRKTGDKTTYCHVFINKGASTLSHDSNIKFYGNGLRIQVNGIDDYTTPYAKHTRAQFQLLNVSNYKIDGVYCDDGGIGQHIMAVVGCIDSATNKSLISNVSFKGDKDGLKIIASKGLKVQNIETQTFDDGISACAADYNDTSAVIGDCSDIEIDGWTDLAHPTGFGRSMLFMCDSWDDWATDTSYTYMEACNNAGNLYRKDSAGSQVSSIAPTHIFGSESGVDGIAWLFIQQSIIKTASVTDILIKNATSTASRVFANFEGDGYILNRKGTAKINRITFDNINFAPTVRNMDFIVLNGILGTLTVKNSTLSPTFSVADWQHSDNIFKAIKRPTISHFDELIFDNCTFNKVNACFNDFTIGATGSKLTLSNCVYNHANTDISAFASNEVGQLTDIVMTDTVMNNTYGLIYAQNPETVVNILTTRCEFPNANRVTLIRGDAVGVTVNYVSIDDVFSEPISYLFQNQSANNSLNVDILRATGAVTPAKKFSSNVTVLQDNWI